MSACRGSRRLRPPGHLAPPGPSCRPLYQEGPRGQGRPARRTLSGLPHVLRSGARALTSVSLSVAHGRRGRAPSTSGHRGVHRVGPCPGQELCKAGKIVVRFQQDFRGCSINPLSAYYVSAVNQGDPALPFLGSRPSRGTVSSNEPGDEEIAQGTQGRGREEVRRGWWVGCGAQGPAL